MEFTSDGDALFAHVVEPVGKPEAGEAQTVVLLHPTPLDHRFWSPVFPSLAGRRIVAPDLRGHGRSALGEAPRRAGAGAPMLTVSQLARDALALLTALKLEQAVFVGCSIGGYTLYELWRSAPARVAAAVFCASKPQADNAAELTRRADWIARHEAARLRSEGRPTTEFVEAMLGTLLSGETQARRPQVAAAARTMMEQVCPESIQAIQRGLAARPDSRETAETFSVPTCVIAGVEDPSSRPEDMAALYELLQKGGASSEYHVLAGAAHYVAMEQPWATGKILAQFCGSAASFARQ